MSLKSVLIAAFVLASGSIAVGETIARDGKSLLVLQTQPGALIRETHGMAMRPDPQPDRTGFAIVLHFMEQHQLSLTERLLEMEYRLARIDEKLDERGGRSS